MMRNNKCLRAETPQLIIIKKKTISNITSITTATTTAATTATIASATTATIATTLLLQLFFVLVHQLARKCLHNETICMFYNEISSLIAVTALLFCLTLLKSL